MAVNPTDIAVKSYDRAKAFRAPVGATAMRPGTLCKFSSNLLIPAADNDKQIRLYVVLEQADANATSTLVVPFADARIELGYSGTPTVGTSYGISDSQTVDAADTTNLMVTVVAVNSTRTTVDVIEYQLSA